MKKLNKLIATFLCFCMVFAMAACGKDDGGMKSGASGTTAEKKDFFSVASESVDTGKADMSIKLKIADSKETLKSLIGTDEITLKLTGDVSRENNQLKGLNIAVSATIGSDNVDLTDVIYKDSTCYINMEKMVNAIIPYVKKSGTNIEASQVMALLGGKKYMSMSESEMKQYMAAAQSSTSASEYMTQAGNYAKYLEVFNKVLATPCKDTLAKVEPAVLSQDGDSYTFKIDKDNLEGVIDQVSTLINNDGEKLLNQLKEEMKSTCGEDDEIYKSLNDTETSKQVEELKTAFSNAKKNIATAKEAEPLIKMTVSSTGNEGSRVLKNNVEFAIKDNESSTSVDVVMDSTMTEDKNVSFTAPTDVASITEIMSTLQSLQGSSTAK